MDILKKATLSKSPQTLAKLEANNSSSQFVTSCFMFDYIFYCQNLALSSNTDLMNKSRKASEAYADQIAIEKNTIQETIMQANIIFDNQDLSDFEKDDLYEPLKKVLDQANASLDSINKNIESMDSYETQKQAAIFAKYEDAYGSRPLALYGKQDLEFTRTLRFSCNKMADNLNDIIKELARATPKNRKKVVLDENKQPQQTVQLVNRTNTNAINTAFRRIFPQVLLTPDVARVMPSALNNPKPNSSHKNLRRYLKAIVECKQFHSQFNYDLDFTQKMVIEFLKVIANGKKFNTEFKFLNETANRITVETATLLLLKIEVNGDEFIKSIYDPQTVYRNQANPTRRQKRLIEQKGPQQLILCKTSGLQRKLIDIFNISSPMVESNINAA